MRLLSIIKISATVFALATPAMAEDWFCTVNAQHARGWLFPKYVLSFEPGSKTIKMATMFEDGKVFATPTAKMISNTDKKVVGSLVWKDVRSASGTVLTVRYRATMYRANGKFQMSVRVGDHGQTEFGRGTCKQIA